MNKSEYHAKKLERRQTKMKSKRIITPDEVIFVFEKILEGWKTIRIYNTIIQLNPNSNVDKKIVEQVATGNCKVFENELTEDKYNYYVELRQRVYEIHK
jgi:DNA-binding ferritin-like protein (Dps family)